MSWGSAGEFFHMGGYGLYVWGSYVVTLGLLGIEVMALIRRKRAVVSKLARELRMEAQ